MKLKDKLQILYVSLDLDSADEVKEACALIIESESLPNSMIETVICAYERGPLFDGDVPSKAARDACIESGYIVKVVVKGEDGFNALTQKGACVYQLLKNIK